MSPNITSSKKNVSVSNFIPNFDDLIVSTKTIMVYMNMNLNIKKLYKELPIYDNINVVLTKKKKIPDLKKTKAPYDSIISIRYRNRFRGLVTKKYDKKIKKKHFKNQITCILSLGDKNINIMIFNNSFKIAGCKSDDQAEELIKLLWSKIKKIENSYVITDEFEPRFVIDSVMTNVDFKLGFKIDRKKLNILMNSEKYKNLIFMSKFERTSNTNVNIKFYSANFDNKYKCLTIPKYGNKFYCTLDHNPYEKKKKKKNKYTTFLVFHSSKTIVSGKNSNIMTDNYRDFINIIFDNKDYITEQIVNKKDDFISYINQI